MGEAVFVDNSMFEVVFLLFSTLFLHYSKLWITMLIDCGQVWITFWGTTNNAFRSLFLKGHCFLKWTLSWVLACFSRPWKKLCTSCPQLCTSYQHSYPQFWIVQIENFQTLSGLFIVFLEFAWYALEMIQKRMFNKIYG